MKIEKIRVRLDKNIEVAIGAPLKLNEIQIGEIVGAEVDGEYVVAEIKLNEKGSKLYNEISKEQNIGTYTVEFEGLK